MNKFSSFLIWFLPITVFTKEIGLLKIFGIEFDFISYPFFIIAFLFLFRRIQIQPVDLLVFFFIFIQGIFIKLYLDLPISLFFKQFIPIVIIYYTCITIISSKNINVVFNNYIKFSYWAALIGFIQLGLKFYGILFLTDYNQFFIDSVALEPSHYIIITLPAALYLFEKKIFNTKFFIISLSIIFTFKITLVWSIAVYLIFRNINKFRALTIFTPLVCIIAYYLIIYVEDFNDRISSLIIFFENQDISEINNSTTLSFVSNLEVAVENIKNTSGLGVGLGGHETTYYNYFIKSLGDIGLNYKSAHSLLIRVISELGVFGLTFFFIIAYKVIKIKNIEYKFIALASLSHFIAKSIKLGGYFGYGTLFFLVLIIVAIRNEKKHI